MKGRLCSGALAAAFIAHNFSANYHAMEWKYGNITSRIIGAALEVHRELGPGFPEYVYRRALVLEFPMQAVHAEPEFPMPVFYKGQLITTRRVDFLAEHIIPTEIKAIVNLDNGHLAQAINYLEAWNLEIGLLINFGAPSLQVKRLLNRRFNPDLNRTCTENP